MTQSFVPGDFVRLQGRPDWGLGQVQSVAGGRVTVNFEDAGKQTIFAGDAVILHAEPEPPAIGRQTG